MSNRQQDLEFAIVQWINTFEDLPEPPQNFDSLIDGIVLTDVMNKIYPEFFDLSKINKGAYENWALRLHNLTYLYERLEKYYAEILRLPFDKKYVDCLKISKNNDYEQLYNLIEVVLGAVVQCKNKEMYINAILTLDEGCQNALMILIEKVLNKCQLDQVAPDSLLNSNSSFENVIIRGSPTKASLFFSKMDQHENNLLLKLEELENENQQINHKMAEMAKENEGLKGKINDLNQELERKNQEVKQMMNDRDKALEQLTSRESQEELEKEVKLRDMKVSELQKFIEELKQKHEVSLLNLQDEVNQSKRKIAELSKLESTMEFYKQKYEDYSKLSARLADLDTQLEDLKAELDESNELNKGLQNKIEVYKEKLEAEKTKNISLDIDVTKKKAEIDSLKSEKKRLEMTNTEIEGKLNELNKQIERFQRDYEDTARHHKSTERAMNKLAGQDFNELIRGLERENETLRSGKKGNFSMMDDGEREIMEKEIEILKAKCFEIETDNQSLREQLSKSKEVQTMERITRENQLLKEEVDRLRRRSSSPHLKYPENSKLEEEVKELRKKLGEQNDALERVKELEEEINSRDGHIKDLTVEIDTLKNIIEEIEDQKLTELRLMGGALEELALRNVNLENQIKAFREQGGAFKSNSFTHLNQNITPIYFKTRR